MRIAMFDTHRYDHQAFTTANASGRHEVLFLEPRLTSATAPLADGFPVVCSFVNDHVDDAAVRRLAHGGVKLIALRSAGFNHVDLAAAHREGLVVVRVPEYSPYAVAEHGVALILSLNRKIHRAFGRVREANFSLDGLVGFDMHGKTVGVVGTGKIGRVFARIMLGFGCVVLAHDVSVDPALEAAGVQFVPLAEIYSRSDVISLHVPLTPGTRHVIDADALAAMKPGVLLINTSRGGLVDTRALVDALKSGHIGAAGLDVYEEEAGLFFNDLSDRVLQDDVLARLLTFPNVLITSHQAFLTHEALAHIAETTLSSVDAFAAGAPLHFQVKP